MLISRPIHDCKWWFITSLFKAEYYSSILAWKLPWTEEPGMLQLMGSPRVGHNHWATIFYGEYIPHLLYPLMRHWIFRLLLCLGYCSAAMNAGVQMYFLSFKLFFIFILYWTWELRGLKNLPAVQETLINPWVGKTPWKEKW